MAAEDRLFSEKQLTRPYRKDVIGTTDLEWIIADLKRLKRELDEASNSITTIEAGGVSASSNGYFPQGWE